VVDSPSRGSAAPSPGPDDGDWARTPAARLANAAYVNGPLRLLRLVFAPTTVRGAEHVRALRGPVVIVANHASHADTMIVATALPAAVRRRLVVAAAADYFFSNRLTSFVSRLFVGAIPVARDKVNRSTLELCHRLLGEGWSLLLYPEGGRSHDGTIGEFKPGAAWIARRAGVPVLPVLLDGTFDVLPKGRSLPTRHRVTVSFGEPLSVADGEDARSFNRRIESAVRDLSS